MDISNRRRLIVFTGAGISKESGIPTFDEIPGIRGKLTRSFAIHNPIEYKQTISELTKFINKATPNAAHYAIGELPDKLVLYGDRAPMYAQARKLVSKLKYNESYFVVVGTSFHTEISRELIMRAYSRRVKVIKINDNAAEKVPLILAEIKRKLE